MSVYSRPWLLQDPTSDAQFGSCCYPALWLATSCCCIPMACCLCDVASDSGESLGNNEWRRRQAAHVLSCRYLRVHVRKRAARLIVLGCPDKRRRSFAVRRLYLAVGVMHSGAPCAAVMERCGARCTCACERSGRVPDDMPLNRPSRPTWTRILCPNDCHGSRQCGMTWILGTEEKKRERERELEAMPALFKVALELGLGSN